MWPIQISKPSFTWLTNALLAIAIAIPVSGCVVGSSYQPPMVATATAYKELAGWVSAAPADAVDRGDWWRRFDDATLNTLMAQVALSNQNVAAATAAYAQARALVREQRAALFPLVSLQGSGRRGGGVVSANSTAVGNNFQVSLGASWEPDVWGRLRRGVDSASAGAEASAADLASALLSAQGELATDYFSLRHNDRQRALLQATIVGYQRTLTIASNRYQAGIASKSDLLQAQTQLVNTQAEEAGLARQRAQFEHAIAMLTGQAPGNFSLPAIAAW